MTTAVAPPPLGSLVYLASYLLRLKLSAEITPPDTPNMYSGEFEVMGDAGLMDLSGLVGKRGNPGQAQFALRRQETPIVESPANLPNYLTDTTEDIGKYWQIATINNQGVITAVQSYIWYGNRWKIIQMGTTGPPGAAPKIQVDVQPIPPQPLPTYPDTTSYMTTSGPTLEPGWQYNLALPQGPPGPAGPIATMPDVDEQTVTPNAGDLFACSGTFDLEGRVIWKPLSPRQFATQFFSIPEDSFSDYTGVAQQAPIGSYIVPPQPFRWTPIVWGHLGGSVANPAGPLNTIQQVVVSAFSGTYTLTIPGIGTTIAIPYDSTPAQVMATIETLVGAGNVVVNAGVQDLSHLIEFVGGLAGSLVETLIADISNLQPAGIASVITDVLQSGGALGTTINQMLSPSPPLRIGCEVLLGDPKNGTLISRGLGNAMGLVNVMPHYSSAANTSQNIAPLNEYAVVPANHTDPAQGTVYFNLWNDGALGAYNYINTNSQLFMFIVPMEQDQPFTFPTPPQPPVQPREEEFVFDAPGSNSWTIPAWCTSFDVVTLGAGGGATTAEGRGGLGGNWGSQTVQVGVDFPPTVTTVNVYVASTTNAAASGGAPAQPTQAWVVVDGNNIMLAEAPGSGSRLEGTEGLAPVPQALTFNGHDYTAGGEVLTGNGTVPGGGGASPTGTGGRGQLWICAYGSARQAEEE